MEQVTRSDGRTLLVGDEVKSPKFGGSGIIKRIDQTRFGVEVTVSFKEHPGTPMAGLDENREHVFRPNDLVAQ